MVEEFENKNRKAYTHIVRVKETTTWYGKNLLKLTLLFILKFFVYIRFLIDQMLHRTKQHVKKKLTKTLETSLENQEPSVFLQSIQEYKKELTKFQKQLGKRK